MLLLPISGTQVRWRPITGHDEVRIAESGSGIDGALVCASAYALAEDRDGAPVDWSGLPMGDLDVLVGARRQELHGDSFVAEGVCGECRAVVDVQFSIGAYVAHNAPRRPKGALPFQGRPSGEPGFEDVWWQLATGVVVRVPTVADVVDARETDDPRAHLLSRCARTPDGAAVSGARRIAAAERGMAMLGPTLYDDVEGSCPECAALVMLGVDLRELCMTELRFLAEAVYDEVHLIASTYGWSQGEILDMPSPRRRRYADLVAGRSAHVVSDEVISVG